MPLFNINIRTIKSLHNKWMSNRYCVKLNLYFSIILKKFKFKHLVLFVLLCCISNGRIFLRLIYLTALN